MAAAGAQRVSDVAVSAASADKQIRVRVAEFDGHNYKYHDWQEKTINDRRTVQAVVQEVYAAFPGYCTRVELRRVGAQVGFNVYRCMEDRIVTVGRKN